MEQNATPVLDAIEQYREQGNHTFALPGHRLGRGIDDRTAAVLSRGAFEADVIRTRRQPPRGLLPDLFRHRIRAEPARRGVGGAGRPPAATRPAVAAGA